MTSTGYKERLVLAASLLRGVRSMPSPMKGEPFDAL